MFEWHKKEKPFLGMAGMGGGVASKLVSLGVAALEASGGIINDYEVSGTYYRSHIFTTPGALTVTAGEVAAADFLIVGGGGGGGISCSPGHGGNGGGGGGGFVEGNALPLSVSTYTITVGQGGGGAAIDIGNLAGSAPARQGQSSSIAGPLITTITANGGGAGGEDNSDTVNPGGSGGGSWGGGGAPGYGTATQPGTNSLYGASDFGYRGGDGHGSSAYCGGGGGGAGGSGGTGDASQAGRGGNGRASTIAYGPTQPVVYAGGGSGGSSPYGGSGIAGPSNGGGGGGTDEIGAFATGGGGGGHGGPTVAGGTGSKCHGGPGIVVVRYEVPEVVATAKATGGLISHYNGKTIHIFINSGQFTVLGSAIPGAEVVLVGGGGAGGTEHGGGGGAGSVVHHPSIPFNANTGYTVTIGRGGSASSSRSGNDGNWPAGEPGLNTALTHPGGPWVAYRGGGGGTWSLANGQPGGCGGGAGANTSLGYGVQPAPNPGATEYGLDGGSGTSGPEYAGGGGGGAGGYGSNGTSSGGGAGGVGWQLPATFQNPAMAPSNTGDQPYRRGGGLGTPGPNGGFYVAGGGGGCGSETWGPGPGGYGGGGDGSMDPLFAGEHNHGLENTGGGGGGGGNNTVAPYKFAAGRGGSGILLIAYPNP